MMRHGLQNMGSVCKKALKMLQDGASQDCTTCIQEIVMVPVNTLSKSYVLLVSPCYTKFAVACVLRCNLNHQ